VYVPSHDLPFFYKGESEFVYKPGLWNLSLDLDELIDAIEAAPPEPKAGLIAWDPVANEQVWRVEHEGPWNGGALATASDLVFQGSGDGRFRAYDAGTGEVLWEVRSQTGIVAGPVTYEVGGEQYVAVAAGWGGGVIAGGFDPTAAITEYHNEGRVLAFKLGGTAPIPENEKRDLTVPAPPNLEFTQAEVDRGKSLYNEQCMACHGMLVASSWLVPDLRYMSPERHEAFEDIVLGGALRGNGMPPFDQYLKPEEIAPLRAYIVSQAQALHAEQQKPSE
jgi:quinohemoprotein ethanol dehydrogenase